MGICDQCVYFRRVRPASQLLALAISTNDAAIASALTKIQEDEQQLRGHEAQHVTKKENVDDQSWDFRPVMSAYCGLHEADGRYLIPGIKNLSGRCTDFLSGHPEKHSCKDCRFRIAAKGLQKDLSERKIFGTMTLNSIGVGASPSISEKLLSRHLEAAASRKAFELSSAYATKGHMMTEPQYLDYCSKFSREEDYVVCVLENPQQTCQGWALR